jgi:hypothetical protein
MRFLWLAVSLGGAVAGLGSAIHYWEIVSNGSLYGPMVYVCLTAIGVCLMFSISAFSSLPDTTARTGAYSGDFAGLMASLAWCSALMLILMGQAPAKGGNVAFLGGIIAALASLVFLVRWSRNRRHRMKP